MVKRLVILFFINLRTRRVVLGGITDHAHEGWMKHVARNMTDAFDGPLLGAKYLLHDRDSKFTASPPASPALLPERHCMPRSDVETG